MKLKHYIYITTNKVNGKRYIGRCSNESSWNSGYLGSGKWLKLSIEKYGKENFDREILEEIHGDLSEAIIAESKWITHYNAKHDKISTIFQKIVGDLIKVIHILKQQKN